MASFNLRFWWWILTVLALISTFVGGAFSSSWANQFKASRDKCNGYHVCFTKEATRDSSFAPSISFLVLAILLQLLLLVIGKEIERQDKENDEIYQLGLEKVRDERLSLKLGNAAKVFDIEKIQREIKRLNEEK